MDYKKAFFSALEESYLGSKVKNQKDKSGFTNLLEIKSQYFQSFKAELEEKIEECGGIDIYNKLYTFFESYLNQTGVPLFNDTPIYKNIYARVYNNSKDTALFYKTQDLYYVKSDTLYEPLEIQDKNEKYTFCFEVDKNNAQNADNSKNKIKFYLIKIEDSKIYIQVTYDKTSIYQQIFKEGEKDFKEDFLKELKENQIVLEEESLKAIFRDYKKQNEIDFFIHKNARSFLQEQFDLWMFNHLYKDSQIHQWELSSIQILQKLRNIAFEIIEKIAKFEDELKAIWLKPKFAKNTQYVFSLDLIYSHIKEPQNLIKAFIEDETFVGQIQEWRELELIDESFSSSELLKDEIFMEEKYRYLPIDTKYLNEKNRYVLLSSFEELESILNGELIKSDNFQALNTLMPKYQGKIDLIYIDPPFNLGSNADFEYKVNFKDSNWATLLENRFSISKSMLSSNGSIFVRCDYNGNFIVRNLLNNIYGSENFINEIIISKSAKLTETIKKYHSGNDSLFLFSKTDNYFFEAQGIKRDERQWRAMHLPGERWSPIPQKYIELFSKENLRNKNNKWTSMARIICGKEMLPPNGRHWALGQETIFELEKENKIRIFDGIPKTQEGEFKKLTSNWTDWVGYSSDWGFQTENHEKILQRCILTASKKNSIIMDFFLGSGTTIATAQKLGRKWLGIEMAEQFDLKIIPRMKKVIAGFQSGISKEVEYKGGGAFRYYELESYEEALRSCEYVLDDERMIDYKKSRKLIKSLNKGERIYLDMQEPSRKDYDIFQTIANIMGWGIKCLFLDKKNIPSCEFSSGEIINLQEIDLAKYPKFKNLIWWK